MHILLHRLAKLVRAHGPENQELHEGTPLSADVLFIGRVELVGEDFTHVKRSPSGLILAKVLH